MKNTLTPPFDLESATQKVRMAEDAWNSRDPERIAKAYSPNSRWRNRCDFLSGREAIRRFLRKKWERELDYRLVKELWAYGDRNIAVRFQYEWQDAAGHWIRSYGNENWQFDDEGLMSWRQASINDVPILERERQFLWDSSAPRPLEHPGLLDSTPQ
jgi:nuclear transport factor 2 (NTF2) superfamily protein